MNLSKGLCAARRGLLVFAAFAMGVGQVVFAGGDDCSIAPVTVVPVGPQGTPFTTTISGDNSAATGPDACSPFDSDLGWLEAFEIDTCAKVTIDFCGQDPVSLPSYITLYRTCPCTGSIVADSFSRSGPCTDFNLWMQFDALSPGRYWYPIYTVPGDLRCEDFTFPPCTSNSDCGLGFTCQDNIHPYTLHITAEEVPTAAGALQASAVPPTHNEAGTVAAIATTSGPDLIVGHVFGCEELGHEGVPGSGTIGMSCSTTACTIGDEGTNWWGLPSVDHPMISVNLFRLSSANGSDRLMQLGQSWIKHGFGTENANDCGFGCDPRCVGGANIGLPCKFNEECPDSTCEGHGNLNAPGCSDTYAASQFVPCDLGPRSMINPYTGVMPASVDLGPSPGCEFMGQETSSYPANDHRDHVHNQISHRLQIQDVDLIPALNPGAEYFAEGQYLVPHEFVAGNGTQNNNVSYRRVTVAGDIACGGFFFDEASGTFTEQPAVNAWPGTVQTLIEPAPLVDGRGFLAYKVTDLGGNVWHYEYALYNMNMDRAMGSLSIPLSDGVVVSSIGFYAPLNHSPEPHAENYTNIPWVVSTAGGAVTWSTDAFGVDPFANAVRFGTMYNFWFNADIPPQPTIATVGLFKTGGSVAAAIVGPSPPPPPLPIPDPTGIKKSRFISFSVPSGASPPETALRVKLMSLHHATYTGGTLPPFTLFEGQSMWVGPPVLYFESGTSGTSFMASKLQCDPYYQDWSTISLLHVTGEAIAPSSSYDVENLAASCMGNEGNCTAVSTPLTIVTARSGDVIINEIANFADISALVAKFQTKPGAPIKARAKLAAGDARGLISIAPNVGFGDIAVDVDAFKGKAYPYKPGKCAGAPTTACIADTDCGTNGPCILCP